MMQLLVSAWLFPALAALTLVAVPAFAWAERGRPYAIFAGIVLGIALPGALVAHPRIVSLLPEVATPWLHALFAYSMAAAGIHMAHLVRARMRPWPFRVLISIPGQVFVAAGALEGVWLLALLPVRGLLLLLGFEGALAALRWLDLLPFVVAIASIVTSMRPSIEWVRVRLGGDGPEQVARIPVERHRRRAPAPLVDRPLRIVQITDPHLGPWQTVAGLRRTVARLLERDPDLVLLTGDFLTMESSGTPGALADAFTPLRELPGRCFAIFRQPRPRGARGGAPRSRRQRDPPARRRRGGGPDGGGSDPADRCRLGPPGAQGAHRGVAGALPPTRRPSAPAAPARPARLPPRAARRGRPHALRAHPRRAGRAGEPGARLDRPHPFALWPDHGLFARGSNRLYVHRGTGFYGFPLRVGVPGEASVLELVV